MQDSAAVLRSRFADGSRLEGFDESQLLAPDDAVRLYLSRVDVRPRGIETVPLEMAHGRFLAADAVAREDHPSHARSTMDGYAVSSGGTRVRRPIVGEVSMGAAAPRALQPGEAMRVPTGGALPDGADAVVPQEDVEITADAIVLRDPVRAGACVSPRGDDIVAGETVLAAGRRIGGPELGVLATLGIATVSVFLRPRIAIVSTGDELVDPASTLRIGEIRDSNRYAIAGALAALGAEPVHFPRAADNIDALRTALRGALAHCDALVTTGGSSVGARDLVPHVVGELGAPGAVVHGIRVKPGKPTLLGAVLGKPVIGLPGNPTSSLMILEAVARPIVLALTGERLQVAAPLAAVAGAPFTGRAGWTWYIPARVFEASGALFAEPLAIRSAHTSLLARASGYAILDETSGTVAAGETVYVHRFSSGGAPIEAAVPGVRP